MNASRVNDDAFLRYVITEELLRMRRTNPALKFERKKAYGCRLNIAAGTAVRFEPGQERTVELVELAGAQVVYGFQGKVMGKL